MDSLDEIAARGVAFEINSYFSKGFLAKVGHFKERDKQLSSWHDDFDGAVDWIRATAGKCQSSQF